QDRGWVETVGGVPPPGIPRVRVGSAANGHPGAAVHLCAALPQHGGEQVKLPAFRHRNAARRQGRGLVGIGHGVVVLWGTGPQYRGTSVPRWNKGIVAGGYCPRSNRESADT